MSVGQPTFSTAEGGYQPNLISAQKQIFINNNPGTVGQYNFNLQLAVNQPGRIYIGCDVARLTSAGNTPTINLVQASFSFSSKTNASQPFTIPLAIPGSAPVFTNYNEYNYFQPDLTYNLPLPFASILYSELNFDPVFPAVANGNPRILYCYPPGPGVGSPGPMMLTCGPTLMFNFPFDQIIFTAQVSYTTGNGGWLGASLVALTL